jgi:hypothetical protein
MQNLSGLNVLYERYREGELVKKDFEGEIFRIILANLKSFYLFEGDKEEAVDYLCWLYPRLSRAIDNYRNNGAPFSSYIGALVRCSTKEYQSRRMDHYITEYAAWTARAADLEVHSPTPEYLKEERKTPPELSVLKSRQILLLILKSYYFASDDFIEKVAPFTGVEKERLAQMIEGLRNRRSRKDEEIREFQERISTQFYRCIAWEKRLKSLMPESGRYEKVQIQLDRARRRLEKMRKRFSRFRVEATHRQIAEVAGVSPGTVSSSLYLLKPFLLHPELPAQNSKGDVQGNSGGDPGQRVRQANPGKAKMGNQKKGRNHAHHRFQDAADGGRNIFSHALHAAAEDQHEGQEAEGSPDIPDIPYSQGYCLQGVLEEQGGQQGAR